ncbi:MAG: phosphate regulon transcriptional regulator PhoB [Porticoccus sp.]|nr:phosphate regulon transcriptional regulator PhoB [Porticoccus sp.]
MNSKTILVVDDEPAIRDMICTALDVAGYDCLQAENAQQAHGIIIDEQPDLVLLDWMMPETSGIELIRRLQRDELTRNVPVIMLTAKAAEDNMVQGLESGADDYITKPFSPRALIARISAVLRRSEAELPQELIQVDHLLFDPISHRVTISNHTITMGPTEFRLLSFFLTHQERVYSRDQILDHVWGSNVYMDERTVDVHIRRLRKAISLEGHDRFIQTVRGAGYRFSTKVVEE